MQDTMLDSIVSNSLQLFADKGFKIRVIMRLGDPWFVAKDACDCLTISNVTQACQTLDEDEKGVCKVETLGGKQDMMVISESGLYTLIMRSNKEQAKPFRRWVTGEVLPSIRKTGGYGMTQISRKDQLFLAIIHSESEEERTDALKELAEINKQEVKALTAERDEAIRTKAQIGSNREATAMNTASQKSKECEKLREQIGDSKTYKRATAIPWLSEYFDTRNTGLYNSVAAQLKKIEASMPPEFAHKDNEDIRYGSVKAYHVAVIERFHEIVREKIPVDKEFMSKYRKDVSPKTKNA